MTTPTQDVAEQTFDLDDVFDNAGGGGGGAPSFEWPTQIDPRNKTRVVPIIDSSVQGEITDIYVTVVKDVNTKQPKINRKGKQMPQVNLTLQTSLRNWDACKSVPLSDPDDPNSPPLAPEEDTGLRRIYVKYRMLDALAAAIQKSPQGKGGPRKGAKVAVKITKLEYDKDPARHPLPDYEARYVPAEEGPADSMFNEVQQQAPPATGSQASDPWSTATSDTTPPF